MNKLKNSIYEIGIDEAGRGPLFGNVYACAVVWEQELNNDLINDSKKLSKKKRKIAYDWIKENIKYYGIGYATNEEIDELNILQATKLAMKRAIDKCIEKINNQFKIKSIIIDGCYWEKYHSEFCDENIKLESVVKGDSKYLSIASASILAKEYHDEHIKQLIDLDNSLNEKYNLLKNMGYGTKAHIQGIKEYGLSKYHRKSFKLKSC